MARTTKIKKLESTHNTNKCWDKEHYHNTWSEYAPSCYNWTRSQTDAVEHFTILNNTCRTERGQSDHKQAVKQCWSNAERWIWLITEITIRQTTVTSQMKYISAPQHQLINVKHKHW